MTSDKTFDVPFTWGDTIKITSMAPRKYAPGAIGSICGIRTISTKNTSEEYQQPIGSRLYLIEFMSGDSIEIPEAYVKT